MEKCKKIAEYLLVFVLIVFCIVALPAAGEENIYSSVVRLHVLPASDSAADQNGKIAVRDAILEEYGALFDSAASADEARALIAAHLDEIEKTANRTLKENGVAATAEATLCEEYFDARRYGEITLPAGYYTSLTVTVGEGEGQNWWCMLYPALCTRAALGETVTEEEIALSPEEYKLVTSTGYVLKFRTLEWLESIFGKNV